MATVTAFKLNTRMLESHGLAKAPWLALTGVAAGSGIWATHFIAMLAYQPQLPVGYEGGATFISLIIAAASTALAFHVASPECSRRTAIAGVVFGLGIATMHYCGMHAFRPQAQMHWDLGMVAVSVLLGVAFSIAAMAFFGDARTWRRQLCGAAVLTLGICSLHFTAMAAVTLLPDPSLPSPIQFMPRVQMMLDVAVLTGLVLAGALVLIVVDMNGRRLSVQRLRLLFDANPVAMWILEEKTLRFLAVNDAAIAQYGYSRAEFERMTAFDIVHPDHRETLRTLIMVDRFERYEGVSLWRHIRADGSEMLVQPFLRPLIYEGAPAGLTALFDVTEREQAATILAAARDAAEASSRAKSDFLANMSHEIRTPLNGVIGVLGVLERTDLTDDQQRLLSIVGSSAVTLQRILSDVLDVSKMESGELDIQAETFDLADAIGGMAGLHAADAHRKGLNYVVEIEPAAAVHVVGDRDRINQIVGNLLSNAVKFTEAGEVRLHVGVEAGPAPRFRFEVADTGVGFDEAFRERLFGRFEQADSSITRRFGGSGLGLSIAHALAQRMGGELAAWSTPGRGSTFVLALPLACGAAAAAEDGSNLDDSPDGGRRLHVLVADDHPVNRQVVELILRNDNVEITAVEDGVQAVEAFARGAFDLVLMDLQMPVMDGLEAIRHIRAAEAKTGRAQAPMFVLSASALPDHIEASQKAGATGHLAKPITAGALLECVASVRAEQARTQAKAA